MGILRWDKLLLPLRLGKEEDLPETEMPGRTHFQRDYDRLIFSSPFRRLQNKTQVFPLPGSVFVHNRLTHSLEVASVGRSMGSMYILLRSRKQRPTIPSPGTIVLSKNFLRSYA